MVHGHDHDHDVAHHDRARNDGGGHDDDDDVENQNDDDDDDKNGCANCWCLSKVVDVMDTVTSPSGPTLDWNCPPYKMVLESRMQR